MVVELDRDPALYSDNNIVEVSVLLSLLSIPQLTVFRRRISGQEHLVIITQLWMVSLFGEQVTYQRKFASFCIWKTFLSNTKFYPS